jgi:hypothetical protein
VLVPRRISIPNRLDVLDGMKREAVDRLNGLRIVRQ